MFPAVSRSNWCALVGAGAPIDGCEVAAHHSAVADGPFARPKLLLVTLCFVVDHRPRATTLQRAMPKVPVVLGSDTRHHRVEWPGSSLLRHLPNASVAQNAHRVSEDFMGSVVDDDAEGGDRRIGTVVQGELVVAAGKEGHVQ